MGGMGFPMDMTSNIKGALFPRADEAPASHATCTIWRIYNEEFVPIPDMIVLGIVDFTDWPDAACPSAEFEQAVKDLCIESNVKEFKCETDEKDPKITHINMSLRSTVSGDNRLPRDCLKRAINKFMKIEKTEDAITCADDGW